MIEKRDCWVCRWCGFAWLVNTPEPPSHCASGKCHRRRWNDGPKQTAVKAVVKAANKIGSQVEEIEDPFSELFELSEPSVEPAKPTDKATASPKTKSCPECFALNGQHQKGCNSGKGCAKRK